MDAWPLFVVGMALLAITLLDVFWTVIASARGGGPITAFLTEALWRVATRRWPDAKHSHPELVGYVTVTMVLLVWVLALWAGLFLASLADPDAVVSSTLQPADAVARAGYAAGALAGAGAAYVRPPSASRSSDPWVST